MAKNVITQDIPVTARPSVQDVLESPRFGVPERDAFGVHAKPATEHEFSMDVAAAQIMAALKKDRRVEGRVSLSSEDWVAIACALARRGQNSRALFAILDHPRATGEDRKPILKQVEAAAATADESMLAAATQRIVEPERRGDAQAARVDTAEARVTSLTEQLAAANARADAAEAALATSQAEVEHLRGQHKDLAQEVDKLRRQVEGLARVQSAPAAAAAPKSPDTGQDASALPAGFLRRMARRLGRFLSIGGSATLGVDADAYDLFDALQSDPRFRNGKGIPVAEIDDLLGAKPARTDRVLDRLAFADDVSLIGEGDDMVIVEGTAARYRRQHDAAAPSPGTGGRYFGSGTTLGRVPTAAPKTDLGLDALGGGQTFAAAAEPPSAGERYPVYIRRPTPATATNTGGVNDLDYLDIPAFLRRQGDTDSPTDDPEPASQPV
jgi:hypothetical protein